MKKSKIEIIREYIATCPFLNDGHIDINYIGKDIGDYSVEEIVTSNPIIKKFTDGSSIRCLLFNLVSREKYEGGVITTNLATSKFYEDFSNWIETNNIKEILPNIEGIQNIECISNGYLTAINDNEAVYQIQMKIEYYKEV